MEFIADLLSALFELLISIGVCLMVGFGFRTGWLLADKFHEGPKEDQDYGSCYSVTYLCISTKHKLQIKADFI